MYSPVVISPGLGVAVAAAVVDGLLVSQLVSNKLTIRQGGQKTRAAFMITNLTEINLFTTKPPINATYLRQRTAVEFFATRNKVKPFASNCLDGTK